MTGLAVATSQGWAVPGLRDHHVHLGLVDRTPLADSRLAAVDDLGWIPEVALAWRSAPPGGRRIRVAGPFLTAVGGYPAGRSWAPPGSVREVADAGQASTAVAELATAGVDLIKVALHAGMPVLDTAQLQAIAATAAQAGLPLVVHAEGPGQVQRAAALAPAALAHVPWTEVLPDPLIRRQAATTAWISTLAIHGDSAAGRVAADNLRRFVAYGGQVRYGTDLGNGPGIPDLDPAEIAALIEAGLDSTAVLRALCRAEDPGHRTVSPYAPPARPDELADWLRTLRRVPRA